MLLSFRSDFGEKYYPCKKLADTLMMYALSIPDDTQRTAYIDFVKRWQRRNYRETILRDAASVFPADMAEFDANPFLFNCLPQRDIESANQRVLQAPCFGHAQQIIRR